MGYKDESYIGSGKFWVREAGTTGPFYELGNISAANFGIESESQSLRNYRGGGGEANKLERITAVSLALTLHDFNSANLAMVLYGDTSTEASAAVAAEAVTGKDSGLLRTAFMIDATQTVTVTDTAGPTVLVEGTDYTVTAAGIEVIEGGGIADATALEIDYTKAAATYVDSLKNSGKTFEMIIDGVNDAQSGLPFIIDVWKFKPSPAQEVGVISDDFASFDISGSVLIDSSKTTTSQYFRRTQKVAA
ncbi:conserved hypothetical protein [Hahella chejuensis KCTC 2396]|uniref:Major tail protein n=1 Tax=Hahella chejuensis (strain KCTC 2396) TaxID=349521 RepID=Q2SI47_HAHCH|nr:hypothetical protein [Hahella chejuensis]ABC29677.1 conserved hypothetical protein [Hahella chejuensis KCTC 2396]